MAGEFLELPASRLFGTSVAMGFSQASSETCSSPSNSSSDTAADPRSYCTCPPHTLIDVDLPAKNRNAGILKRTNRVKFIVSELESQEPTGGVLGESRLDRRGRSMLPQRPPPAASIPSSQEKRPLGTQQGHSVEVRSYGASADVTGLSIYYRTSSPGTVGDDEISLGADDKGRAISCAHGQTQRLLSLLSRSPKSPKPVSGSGLGLSIASSPFEVVFPSDYVDEIPLINFPDKRHLEDSSLTITDEEEAGALDGRSISHTTEAQVTRHQMSRPDFSSFITRVRPPSPGPLSGQVTPSESRDSETYDERPRGSRAGILSSILKLYDQQHGGNRHSYSQGQYGHSRQGSTSEDNGHDVSSDTVWRSHRPRKWYEKSLSQSTASLTGSTKNTSPHNMLKRSRSSGAIGTHGSGGTCRRWAKPQLEDEIRITVHIAELLSRQRYLITLCRALMKYGAPTHRLEEYMRMTARVLEIDGQFLYIPGCMIISFDDASTHTTEVKVVRSNQGIDLGKLADVHEIYKEVIHDVIGVEEAIQRLNEIMKKRSKFHILFLIFAHGCASASVGPFAFNARPIDMPIAFLLGCLLGVLQLILYPKSSLYSNVFEISAAVLTSFLARAFGTLILPGYTVLCASLELQSRSIVAGSVRMVYAIIYSLFLGFGITIGTAVYGLLDSQASTAYTCPASPITNEYLQRFPFVLIFTACLAIVNHAKWKQIPVMLAISLAGYAVSYISSKRFYSNTQVSNALGAFVIGVMGNVYSRLRHGLAAAAMLPAIFVLVPSGLAASGSLISGITSAEEMTRSPYAVVANGTQGFVDAAKNLSSAEARNQSYGVVFDIGYGMVQVAIGTTVGLFLAALVVYPLGKKRSGLFSF
ncbi:hypothetical protein N7462_002120 [Penicillium macrosclerotiorum]|uniref:uncharacterized protein n=1 Tax=Penicillium macrosclerotiorum TaxID=303699 RepID=UPI002547D08A|nr:uncharacterized protein N7462_002120 [Penicillium macrosclerotiorum]KAJ5692697.1 hypothetical protein N7462_002120 [Penicillium macrosclerotiorum]